MRFLHWLGFHFWEYRNPFNRRCKLCRRHEVEYFYPHEWGRAYYGGMVGYNEWEVYYDGDEPK